ncbi:MAG: Rossmann-like and DUF2520 domain-containing protein [Leucothrix sp.]
MHQRLNFIGCGQLGKTLGHLWQHSHTICIGDVLTRANASAQSAVGMMGAGRAITAIDDMQAAEIYLIACGDDAIEDCSKQLASSGLLRQGDVVFHCSGAQPSTLLQACKEQGALTASIHPIKSFAQLSLAIESFAGTYCGTEGDQGALDILHPLFATIGANLLPIQTAHKTLYHAASVIASNYLVTLQEISLLTFEKAGINRETATAILQPIVTGTVENIFHLGTSAALTGPIARGDSEVVSAQLTAMQDWNEDFAATYKILGKLSLPIAAEKGTADMADLALLHRLLDEPPQ